MNRLTITCASCGQRWATRKVFSLYDQQAVESCPCPRCGAYTLCCQEPAETRPIEQANPVRGWRPVAVRS